MEVSIVVLSFCCCLSLALTSLFDKFGLDLNVSLGLFDFNWCMDLRFGLIDFQCLWMILNALLACGLNLVVKDIDLAWLCFFCFLH